MLTDELIQTVRNAVDERRIVETARALVDIPSPTRSAGEVADKLAEILSQDGFEVERPETDWPEAPAVVTRVDSGADGRTLQFDGHLDTVHLPFSASDIVDGNLTGSGASDMKGGVAAFVEALRILRDGQLPKAGSVLMTAHDHHEGPWGDKRQLKALIRDGYVGDAVMFPEYLATSLPLRGRGMSIFRATFERDGDPVHEVLRPAYLPMVNAAGSDFLLEMQKLNEVLGDRSTGPSRETVFTGQIQGGEIYNQAPASCLVAGTRRWTTSGAGEEAVAEVRGTAEKVAERHGVRLDFQYSIQGDAFTVSDDAPIVEAFQSAYAGVVGEPLALGEKPFLDDGNIMNEFAGIPPITHGPDAKGAHTLEESVPVSELVRVAEVYALTAIGFCSGT
ncbi:TPA: hypothetical protein DCE37_26740 [Candidatus Latescibacteria bacterium]|nr:hypothetical protein [Candidatus Latescibacterota bacterium]